MSDGDIFREVDEAIRQDRLKTVWDKYGVYALAVAFLIVAGVAGYKGWIYWQNKRASEAGTRFVGAVKLLEEGKKDDALLAFNEIAKDAPGGYALLARFRLAASQAANGKADAAVEIYDGIVSEGGADEQLSGYAAVRAATLRVDKADFNEMKRRLEPLIENDGPWRHSARELLGLSAFRTGNAAEAETYFTQALTDPQSPANLKRRAEMMLSLVVKADERPKAKTAR